jgi:acyl carrier protein|tara:strand:+ start:187 stop:408 length:222 start_codon:yes stop_codon:yes gene_type:complete
MKEFIENFYEILDDTERQEINQHTDFKNLDEWDSMTTLMLIAMVDEKYEKQVSGKEIKESISLEQLYSSIQSK